MIESPPISPRKIMTTHQDCWNCWHRMLTIHSVFCDPSYFLPAEIFRGLLLSPTALEWILEM